METYILIIVAALLLLAALGTILFALRRNNALSAERKQLADEKDILVAEKNELIRRVAEAETRLEASVAQSEELKGSFEKERAAIAALSEERQKVFEAQKKQMEESFKLLSEENSASLRRQNQESINELLKPIQEKFGEFDKSVKESKENAIAQDAALRQLLESMMEKTTSVGNEARNLANALTGHSKIQGDFGEMLLLDLLKSSGLQEGIHFKAQSVITDNLGHEVKSDSGGTMIPDVVLYYPDDTEVVIDSKVSLSAFVDYANAEKLEDRKKYAAIHIKSIENHIDELKKKDYSSYIEENKKKVDYNIMFIPMEGAFRLMLEEAPTLWQRAKDAKVLIVSQMNLMIVLNMIMMSWKQHDQERNIQEVYNTGAELMTQIKAWLSSFEKLGTQLRQAGDAYDDAKKKLMESNQSVIKKIDKLERLGVTPKRSKAAIKSGARMVKGNESVIPSSLADGLDDETTIEQ